jgi:hypothetical protein
MGVGTLPQNAGILRETSCSNMKNTEQNAQTETRPSVRAIMYKLLLQLRLRRSIDLE